MHAHHDGCTPLEKKKVPLILYHRRFWTTSGGTGPNSLLPVPRSVEPRERRSLVGEESMVSIVD